jgi:hypothetical protein
MRLLSAIRILAILLGFGLAIGCGARAKARKAAPHELLKQGRYAEARAAVLAKNDRTPKDRAVFAAALIAETPSTDNAEQAIEAMSTGAGDEDIASAATKLLKFAYEIRQPLDTETSFIFAEVAIGALGHGPLAPSTEQIYVEETNRRVGIAALDRVRSAISETTATFNTSRIHTIWNGCFALLGSQLEATDDFEAWEMFQNIGGIAAVVQRALPNSALGTALLDAAIIVLEINPEISIAAKCDLGSPYDALRAALAHDRSRAGRFELAVSGAVGCTRGTYAPEPR